jgi:gamma-glutamyl hercynylcysteine S-oxide synthase
VSQAARKAEIRRSMEECRARTLRLLDLVPDELLTLRVHDFYSPVGWHFGHVGMTEEYWVMVRALGRPPRDERLSFLFANLPENPKDNRVHLPSRREIIGYLCDTRHTVLAAIDDTDLSSPDPLLADGYGWEFAYRHECQHQETIVELLQLLHMHRSAALPLAGRVGEGGVTVEEEPPVTNASLPPIPPTRERADRPQTAETSTDFIALPGGVFRMGSNDRHNYDNEKCEHDVEVLPFELQRTPVTAADWLGFMENGAYRHRHLWSDDGWTWREREGAEQPEYWQPDGSNFGYAYSGPMGARTIHPQEPVSSISWYEADAYCRWAGLRLPTEAEWEFAARYDSATGLSRLYPWGGEPPKPDRADFGLHDWKPGPVGSKPAGASAFGILDMAGGVWEWTSSPFLPYPGFEAFPYDGYSKEHMDGKHYVCRGGSWATSAPILRSSFRNWYVPTYRQGLIGLRCARDVR